MCGGLMGALTLAIPAEQRGRRLRLLLALQPRPHPQLRLRRPAARPGRLGGGAHPVGRRAAGGRRALLIAMGLYLAGWWSGLTRVEALGRGLWRHLEPFARRLLPVSSLPRALLLGAIWGLAALRGWSTAPLLWATSQGSRHWTALLMLAFGLGTWPVLLATGMAAERVTALLRRRGVRIVGGLMVILFGLWTLPGPHQAWLMGH
ncbi:sulfite exporter TauE/SafE family protein [Pseudomonas aeruginosa]